MAFHANLGLYRLNAGYPDTGLLVALLGFDPVIPGLAVRSSASGLRR
jgi:hypothetical protein